MKTVLAVPVLCAPLLASVSLLAQNQPSKGPAACGDLNVDVSVSLDERIHNAGAPQPDKALVYFIQETGQTYNLFYPTTKVGMDGEWVGANKKNSYFSFFVVPGEHHFCVAIQSSIVSESVELSHFRADAGKVYYFRTRISMGESSPQYLSVDPVDSDQAEFLIESFPLAKLEITNGKAAAPGRTTLKGNSR
jgi:hypothetical protein